MKTMQLDNQIVRVSDSEGANLFLEGWKYVPKSVWKEKVRDTEAKEEKPTKKKSNKMSKAEKRHMRKQTKK
jgi:hypothetical protein